VYALPPPLDRLPALLPQAVTLLLGIALLLALVALVLSGVANARAGRMIRRYRALMTGTDGTDLSSVLTAYLARLDAAEQKVTRAEGRVHRMDGRSRSAVQRVGLSRYSGLEPGGGELSFSLALLDDAADGIVITALNGRDRTRVLAKPIQGGGSPYALTPEEARVIAEAMGRGEDPGA